MKRKQLSDPMDFIAKQSMLGKAADEQILPFLVHLEEIRQGRGNQANYDVCVVYLQAMLCTVVSAKNQQLRAMMLDACNAWIAADSERAKKNTDRIELTKEQMGAVSKAIRFFLMVMPQVKVGIWTAAHDYGKKVLELSIAEYNTQHAVNT